MEKFSRNDKGWYCGFWNNNDISIYKHLDRNKLYDGEKLHYHNDFSEYYMITKGELFIIVNGKEFSIKKDDLFKVDAKEKHKVIKFGKEGCEYIVIKEKSYNGSTVIV